MTRFGRFVLFALAYLGFSAIWIYGVVDRGGLEGSDRRVWTFLVVVAVLHIVFGFGIREWPALLLPITVLLLAIQAGYPESRFGEPGPVWLGQLVLIPFEIVLIAAGLGLRALVDGRRTRTEDALR